MKPRIIVISPENCPIRQFDGDGRSVGRCWYYMRDGHTCPLHGEVSAAVEHYRATGKMTDETDLPKGWQAAARAK